jgi:hypothetical protein
MSRFSTSAGKFVGLNHLPNITISLCQAIVRKTTGHIPRLPWIPFAARKALESVITPDFFVWEVGAGFSTLWLSDRVKKLVSIEAARDWYENLGAIIAKEQIKNVDLRFEWVADRMADFSELPDESLDLLFIDGGPRGQCLENGFRKVKKGGYVYLDNWDTKIFWDDAVSFPERNAALIAEVRSFVDYVPAQVGVYEGLLLKKA